MGLNGEKIDKGVGSYMNFCNDKELYVKCPQQRGRARMCTWALHQMFRVVDLGSHPKYQPSLSIKTKVISASDTFTGRVWNVTRTFVVSRQQVRFC